MATSDMEKRISNGKPCEICAVFIRAIKGATLCQPCHEQVKKLNQLWTRPSLDATHESTNR